MKALQADGKLLKQFEAELKRASKFYVGMALVTQSGLELLQPAIEEVFERGGRGLLLFGIDLPTEPEAIARLCELQAKHKRMFELRRFQPGKRFFHAKLSIFEAPSGAKTAIIGSSNLTEGGLSENYETNVFIDDRKIVQHLLDYFEEHFHGAHAKRVDECWLDQYRQIWIKRRKNEQRQRRLRERLRHLGGTPSNTPGQIKGHVFAFTGKITDWPRHHRLYPFIRRRGGRVAETAGAMSLAECLVHGEILGGRKSTRKLVRAHEMKIPIITEEQFFKLAGIDS